MADTNTTERTRTQDGTNDRLRSQANQTDNPNMRHEQTQGGVSGERGIDRSQYDNGRPQTGSVSGQRQEERGENSAIGGGTHSRTGEPGRARDELDRNKTHGSSSKMSNNETSSQR